MTMDAIQRLLLFIKESLSTDVLTAVFTAIVASIIYELLAGPFRKFLLAKYDVFKTRTAHRTRIISVQTPTGKSINIKVNSGISDEQAKLIAMEILTREQTDKDGSTTQIER